jgi:CBS domain-containing protein
VDVLLATAQHQFPVLDGHRKPVGLLVREDLIAALGARPREAPLADIMRAPVTLVRAGQDLGEAMTLLGGGGTPALCVVDEAGALVNRSRYNNIGAQVRDDGTATATPVWQTW